MNGSDNLDAPKVPPLHCTGCGWRSVVEATRTPEARRAPTPAAQNVLNVPFGYCPECGRSPVSIEEGTFLCTCEGGESAAAVSTRAACLVGKLIGLHSFGAQVTFDGEGSFLITAGEPVRPRRRRASPRPVADDIVEVLLDLHKRALQMANAKQSDYWTGSGSENTTGSMASHAQAKCEVAQACGKLILTALTKLGVSERALPEKPDPEDKYNDPAFNAVVKLRYAQARSKLAGRLREAASHADSRAHADALDAEEEAREVLGLPREED